MASVGALLLLACCSLCWRLILAHNHVDLRNVDSGLTTVEFSASEAQSFSAPGILTSSIEGNQFANEHNHPIFALKGSLVQNNIFFLQPHVTTYRKWKRILGGIAEWVLHACIVVLAIFAIYYTVSCVCACCIGLDLLAEIWRVLGGWRAFSYFVHVEQAVIETDPPPLPLLRRTAEEP